MAFPLHAHQPGLSALLCAILCHVLQPYWSFNFQSEPARIGTPACSHAKHQLFVSLAEDLAKRALPADQPSEDTVEKKQKLGIASPPGLSVTEANDPSNANLNTLAEGRVKDEAQVKLEDGKEAAAAFWSSLEAKQDGGTVKEVLQLADMLTDHQAITTACRVCFGIQAWLIGLQDVAGSSYYDCIPT